MDTTLRVGTAGNEQGRKDEKESWDELKKAREALAEGRRREEELEGVVREGERAMRELEEWIGRKVDAMSSLATVLREGWLREAVLSQAEGARKRARMADGSPAHPMIMMELKAPSFLCFSHRPISTICLLPTLPHPLLVFPLVPSFASPPFPYFPPQQHFTAARTAGSIGGARVDSGGAVTDVDERHAHKGGGKGRAGRAGGPQVGRPRQWPAGRVASKAEVRARLQSAIDHVLRIRPANVTLENTTRGINRVVSQLFDHPDPTAKELSLSNLELVHYLYLTPHCYPDLLPSVTTLNLQKLHPVSPNAIKLLLRLPSLTALHFHETSIRSDALRLFPCLSPLRRLVIASPDPSGVINLSASRQGNLPAPSNPVRRIQPFQSLKELHVSRVTDSILQHLGVLARLEVLSCTYSKGVTSQGWNHLRRLQNLKRLLLAPTMVIKDWGSNDQLPASSFLLRRFPLSLDFSQSRLPKIIRTFQRPPKNGAAAASEDPSDEPRNRIDGSIWEVVAALPGLQHLEIHAPEPSATALRSLSNITQLKTLRITGTTIHDSDLVGLSGLSLLTSLSLASCTFAASQAVRLVIQGMTQLKSLDLSGTAISQWAAVHLQALERLERLRLQQCRGMSKLFVEHLSLVPALRELDLSCNNMQHAWLLPILEGKKVTRLGVGGCGFVPKTVQRLQRDWIKVESR
ncbi:unnamed protein product [Closterium sp. Naga37s-1]|nr:unnamed protein product [Closterium sp. Naga37s-1]